MMNFLKLRLPCIDGHCGRERMVRAMVMKEQECKSFNPIMGLMIFFALIGIASGAQFGDFSYTVVGSTITITYYTGAGGDVIIPSSINGTNVTSIGDYAFEFCTSLTSVTIPDSVTSIGDWAFDYCTSLTNVIIGTNVTSIRERAFYSCTSLTSVTIPDSVTNIGDLVFQRCTSLTSVTIPDSVTSIGELAFDDCTSLTNISVHVDNPNYLTANGVLFDKTKTTLIKYPGGKAGNYTIPDSVTSIRWSAFESCTSLTSITIPDSVTSIGCYAFYNCTSLTSVTIPDSVTSIDSWAFNNCTSLTSITIPDSVTSIDSWAFNNCTSLTSITIPDSVTSIGEYAFYNCTKLAKIYFKGNAPNLGADVFSGDTNIVHYLPNTTGWGTTFGGLSAILWNPKVQDDASFGVLTNRFGFNVAATNNIGLVVVEACTNLANPVWFSLQTKTLNSNSVYFSDSEWTNYPARFYRLNWP